MTLVEQISDYSDICRHFLFIEIGSILVSIIFLVIAAGEGIPFSENRCLKHQSPHAARMAGQE
jgi:hypothetical protein